MSSPIRTIDLPEDIYRITGGSFRLNSQGETFRSQFVPGLVSTGPRFMFWSADLELAPMYQDGNRDIRRRWSSFVTKNQGGAVAFRIYDPFRMAPSGKGAGISSDGTIGREVKLVDAQGRKFSLGSQALHEGSATCTIHEAAERYSDTVVMTGLIPNADVFYEGDLFEVGGNLYEIVQDAVSDAQGRSRIFFMWRLWKGVVPGDLVTLVRPTARFQFSSVDEGGISHDLVFGHASFKAVEVPFI